MTKRYTVIGAGAIGSVVGAALSAAGNAVTMVDRRPRVEFLRRAGITTAGAWNSAARIDVRDRDDPWPSNADPDVVCLAVPTSATPEVLAHLPSRVEDVICFQNGVANERLLGATGRIARGALVACAAHVDPAGAVHVTRAPRFILGRHPRGSDDVCIDASNDLRRGGVDASHTNRLETLKMAKLVANLGSSVLALTGQSGEEALADPISRRCIAALLTEAIGVLDATHVEFELPWAPGALRAMAQRVDTSCGTARNGVEAHPSLTQQIAMGQPTEVDERTGEIAYLAREHGLAAPINDTVTALLRAGDRALTPEQLWSCLNPTSQHSHD